MAEKTEDQWGSNDPENISITQIETLSGTQLAKLSPIDFIEYKRKIENTINKHTNTLIISLCYCDQVVMAAYEVADYVPPHMNDEQSKFWKHEVIPSLVQSLTQDVKARNIISKSYSSIQNLAITIQRASEIVRLSKGSQKAIEIAQKNIPLALAKIDEHIEEVSKLEDSVFKVFVEQKEKLIEIIGPKSSIFVDQKVDLKTKLNLVYKKMDKDDYAIAEKLGEVTRYNHIMNAIEKQLTSELSEFVESNLRNNELKKLNQLLEKSVQNIQIETNSTTTTGKNSGGLLYETTFKATTIHMESNQNAELEKYHYESIIRGVPIKHNKNDEKSMEEATDKLNKILAELKGKYTKSYTELENMQKSYDERMSVRQSEIYCINRQIKALDKSLGKAENTVDLEGNVLINCIISVRTFANSLKGGTSAYSPLINILKAIKAMVQNEFELLNTSSKVDIFLAGTLLMKNVKFLSGYSANSSKA